jgi:hypothetical protein
MYVTRDNVLYFGDGQFVHKLKAVGTFNPATPATYSFTSQFLDTKIPNTNIVCLSELGTYLACGTRMGTAAISPNKKADIYFWNSNLAADQFTTKVSLQEGGIRAMFNDGNTLYVQAGSAGNIYLVNQYQQFARIKKLNFLGLNDNFGTNVFTFNGAMTKCQNELIWGTSTGTTNISPLGVMGISLDDDPNNPYPMYLRNLQSDGADGSLGSISIGALLAIDNNAVLIGRAGGIDVVGMAAGGNGARYTSYSAYLESQLYPTGTTLNNRSFSTIEFSLDKPLTAGQGVRLKYRKTLADPWTTITSEKCPTGVLDFTSLGSVISYSMPALISDSEYVQVRCELTSTDTTSPELRAVRLIA